ncbi:MAG: hypothetical protein IID51_12920 [Proteobacteria bacterium]|nr:hypothetical protein [Pseudomonadota bacterium]
MSAMRIALLFLAGITLQGCQQPENFDDAEQSVSLFHDRLNLALYEEIWELTAPGFGEAQVREDARAVFSAMHSRLGLVLDSEIIDASFYTSSEEGAMVTLVYRTTFERGSGTEIFTFATESGASLLLNYNISSRDFSGEDVSDYQRLAESAVQR